MVAVWNLTSPSPNRGATSLPDFLFPKENLMSALTLIVILIGLPVSTWALWFVIEFVRYTFSGEYELDKRLRDICK
jgi:hypothetical protein